METGYGGIWHGNGHFDAISPTHKFDLSMFRWCLHVFNVFMINAVCLVALMSKWDHMIVHECVHAYVGCFHVS